MEGPNWTGGGGDGGEQGGDTYRGFQLGEGGGTHPDGVWVGVTGGGGHVAGGGTDSQGEKGIPWHWPLGGDVEGSGGDFKLPAHSLHHLPRIPPHISGGSWHMYRHPRTESS